MSIKEVDFMSELHTQTERDYLGRVNSTKFPKAKAAKLAKLYGYDYWDGDREICYGGYNYIKGRWERVAKKISEYYNLPNNAKILDVGCGKGYLLYDFKKILPDCEVFGIDISEYAIKNSKEELEGRLRLGNATNLPWDDNTFDIVISITTLHNLKAYELDLALREIERVGKKKYLCVESYRTEEEKANLLYWQVTCEAFNTPEEWRWWFNLTGYTGDFSFIYFE